MSDPNKPGPSVEMVPEGDNRPRLVCPDCGYIAYENPKVVVGAVCEWEGRVLLCRRAIEPRLGFWTIPAGFMELGETMAEGAAREVLEEACTRVEMGALIGIYEISRISQVHVFFQARMTGPDFAPGSESQEVELVDWADIPWPELAFPSVIWALKKSRGTSEPAIERAPDGSWPREFSLG
jgi:ADP-ribose pyrophosphatase YjhB (NUDIX family)